MSDIGNSVWSATALALDESNIKNAALSVRQRKLLALLATPMSVDALSTMSGIVHAEVETNLQRFHKLGLASSDADVPIAAAPSDLRPSTFAAATTAAGSSNNKTPIIIGGVALSALAAAIWWFTRSNPVPPGPSAAQNASTQPVATPNAPPAANTAPLAAPGDSATTNVFVSGAPAVADAIRQATAKEAAAAAKDAAKNAKAAPTTNAPIPAATSPTVAAAPTPAPNAAPAPASSPTAAAPPPPAPTPAPAPAPTPAPAAAAPVVAAPPPAPAAARPTAAPAPAAVREGALISRVEPAFPRTAEVDRGTVRARLSVNATGAVTNVEIVDANPPRVFDRNVRSALSQWRYEGTGETQTKLVEVQFTR